MSQIGMDLVFCLLASQRLSEEENKFTKTNASCFTFKVAIIWNYVELLMNTFM